MAIQPFRDIGLKSVAVCLAVLLWFTVGADPLVERGLEVPLQFENVPADLEIIDDPPGTVQVRVRGSAGVVNRLEPGQVVARLDLDGQPAGRRLFDLFGGWIQAPAGVEVTHVVPATVTMTLERAGRPKAVRIVPDIEGRPAAGYAVGSISTEPEMVDVVGAETRLAALHEAVTESVTITGAMSSVVEDVTVGVADPAVRLARPQTARVTVEIVPAPLERTVRDVPVVADGRDQGVVAIEPARVAVRIVGPHSVVLAVDGTTLRAQVDVGELPPGRHALPVTIASSESVRVGQIDPPFVSVTLR